MPAKVDELLGKLECKQDIEALKVAVKNITWSSDAQLNNFLTMMFFMHINAQIEIKLVTFIYEFFHLHKEFYKQATPQYDIKHVHVFNNLLNKLALCGTDGSNKLIFLSELF